MKTIWRYRKMNGVVSKAHVFPVVSTINRSWVALCNNIQPFNWPEEEWNEINIDRLPPGVDLCATCMRLAKMI
jgi:hypothetical protein